MRPGEGGFRTGMRWGRRLGCGMEDSLVEGVLAGSGYWLGNSIC